MPIAILTDRAVIRISGADAEHFLQNLITTDLDGLAQGEARPGALLTPQGKILFDFLVSRDGEGGFLLDCPAGAAGDFMRRLMLYNTIFLLYVSLYCYFILPIFFKKTGLFKYSCKTKVLINAIN